MLGMKTLKIDPCGTNNEKDGIKGYALYADLEQVILS